MYLHVEEPPESPKSVRLGGVGTRWVRLIWRSLPGLGVYYSALCTALHSLPGVEAKHTTANLSLESLGDERVEPDGYKTLSARLENLRPAAAYSLRLIAANHVGQSPHSDPLLFTTLEEAPSASPQNVRVRPANIGELHLSWSAPPQDSWNGELLGYVASWRELSRFEEEAGEDGERSGSATSPGWSSAEMTLGGLRSFARYAVSLRAYNRAGAGPPSPLVYATTADGVPEAPPTSVFCEAVSARSLRVRWAAPPGAQHAHSLRGYELHYAPLHLSPSWSGAGGGMVARAGAGGGAGEATLQGLRAATNYSVSVRARADRGLGPPSPPVYCSTREDVPGAAEAIRALAASADAVRVSWLPPALRAGRLTHYTLYTRELGKVGGEWSQRVEAGEGDEAAEVWREVVGLRERTVYEFWVRASTAAGAGPPTRPVTAAPTQHLSVRISSFGRVVYAPQGARVRLRCAAVGPPPLRRRWAPAPAPPALSVTEAGDLIIHKAEVNANFTCSVRGGGGGGDAAQYALVVRAPPAAPAPRLVRADTHALHLAWDPPPDLGTALLGYTVWWTRGGDSTQGARAARVGGEETALWLRGLACGALYRVTVRAHNAVGASPHSRPLLARTRGDKAKAPPGKEFVWANSTALRLNLLAWGGRCPVAAWAVAVRATAPFAPAPGPWQDLVADGESALASNLKPGTWYEIRVVARSPAGDTPALYRAATHTVNGERMGEPTELPVEARSQLADGAAEVVPEWRLSLAPLLLGGGLAALLASLAVGLMLARRRELCVRRECSLHEARAPHPQLYTTEPGKRNGKTLTPPDSELHEISPYATFSMAGGAGAGGGGAGAEGGCALHLRTFGRAESLDLAAPPPRPNLLAHASEYGRARDSDSESSGSPCAACAAELYRLPAAHLSDTLPAMESSADDTSYSAGAGSRGGARGEVRSARGERGARAARGRRRRDHARHASGPTVRYFAAGAQPRQQAL
ncbi:cell adhesion molecule Dscam2-like [Ostrinia nubilalis]|uniref:cell adhesion molecule Dscam2-like n=1 Tax=Ostrinia nubilalis TaxID=29057 RepID=UPI0030823BCF